MSDDLIASLRALAAAQHADLSLAADAVIEIERMTRERDEALAEVEKLRAALRDIERGDYSDPMCQRTPEQRARKALEGKQ